MSATSLLSPVKKASPHLILLLEAVALSPLHLGDVLQQVSHSDGGLELPSGVGHLHGLAAAVRVRLDGQGRLGQLPVAAVCGTHTRQNKPSSHTCHPQFPPLSVFCSFLCFLLPAGKRK